MFEAEGNVYQCYSVVIWEFGFLHYYQIGRDVEEAVVGFFGKLLKVRYPNACAEKVCKP